MTDGNTDAINRHLAEREGTPPQHPISVVTNLQAFLDDNSLPRDEHDAMAEAADYIEELQAKLAQVKIDYDTAPTDPHHGGKLMLHQMPARIRELEAKLAEVEAERDAWETAHYQSVEMKKKLSNWYVEAEAMLPRAYRAGVEACAKFTHDNEVGTHPRTGYIVGPSVVEDVQGTHPGMAYSDAIRALPPLTAAELIEQLKETE